MKQPRTQLENISQGKVQNVPKGIHLPQFYLMLLWLDCSNVISSCYLFRSVQNTLHNIVIASNSTTKSPNFSQHIWYGCTSDHCYCMRMMSSFMWNTGHFLIWLFYITVLKDINASQDVSQSFAAQLQQNLSLFLRPNTTFEMLQQAIWTLTQSGFPKTCV